MASSTVFPSMRTFSKVTISEIFSNWTATLSQDLLVPHLLIRTAPTACYIVSQCQIPSNLLFSHITPSTSSCRCGLLRSRYQDGVKCEKILLLEMSVWKETGKEQERAGKVVNCNASLTPSEGERERRSWKWKHPRLACSLRKVWQSQQGILKPKSLTVGSHVS